MVNKLNRVFIFSIEAESAIFIQPNVSCKAAGDTSLLGCEHRGRSRKIRAADPIGLLEEAADLMERFVPVVVPARSVDS